MNSFASFVHTLKSLFFRSAHVQVTGSGCETLTLIPNSALPKQFSTTTRKVLPTKRLIDPDFVYTNSANTDISKTFQQLNRIQNERKKQSQHGCLQKTDRSTIKTSGKDA